MSKKCTVTRNGVVADICEAEDAFDIYEGEDAEMAWVDVPDDVDLEAMIDPHCFNGTFVDTYMPDTVARKEVARRTAYGPIEDQLDMQYKDKLNGTTTWEDHIAEVKKMPAPKDGTGEFDYPAPRAEPHWEKI